MKYYLIALIILLSLVGCKDKYSNTSIPESKANPVFWQKFEDDSIGYQLMFRDGGLTTYPEHKDSLKLTLMIDKLAYNGQEYEVEFYHEGFFKNETPLIKVNDSTALHYAVSRVAQFGKKGYLYQSSIFLLDENKWRRLGSLSSWQELKLGKVSNGTSIGYSFAKYFTNEGKQYFDFHGLVKIE
ncbi:MAG: hypothetical protein MRZ79_27375 [Bacteroidia bacterium]|nr:hypothetical protein [Bacteroidia bacterium]